MKFILILFSLIYTLFAQDIKIKLDSKTLQNFKTLDVTIAYDPVYKTTKNYEGYKLLDIVDFYLKNSNNFKPLQIFFIAEDGYKIVLPFNQITSDAILAFKDKNASAQNKWVSFEHGKETITPAPYYLVWNNDIKGSNKKYPYQVVEIILSDKEEYSDLIPTNSSKSVKNGSAVFMYYCISCHSINLQGGSLAPELNTPKNVTEYFNADALPSFIKKVSNFRAKSKMPDFDNLSDAEVNDVISYLQWLKVNKKLNN